MPSGTVLQPGSGAQTREVALGVGVRIREICWVCLSGEKAAEAKPWGAPTVCGPVGWEGSGGSHGWMEG